MTSPLSKLGPKLLSTTLIPRKSVSQINGSSLQCLTAAWHLSNQTSEACSVQCVSPEEAKGTKGRGDETATVDCNNATRERLFESIMLLQF